MKRITATLLIVAAGGLTGCHNLDSDGFLPWQDKKADKKPTKRHPLKVADAAASKKQGDESNPLWDFGSKKEKEPDEPVKMFITWTESEYTQMNKPPIRGFTARAYFYNKNYEPIEVDGQLIVYGFDDTHREGAKRSPDKKFVFPPEHLANQFSASHLGPSYSLWIPWDKVGGEQKHVSLLPVFRTSQGQIVRGEQIVNILHGNKPEGQQQAGRSSGDSASGHGGVRQVAFNGPLGDSAAGSIQGDQSSDTLMNTATINVPRATLRHLQAPLAPTTNLTLRNQLGPIRETEPTVQRPRQKSAHYIFDSSRTPIRPRDARRYPAAMGTGSGTPSVASGTQNMAAANYAAFANQAGQPSVRSEPRTPQAPARPPAQPMNGHGPWQQYRAAPPYGQPPTLQSSPPLPPVGYSPVAQPVAH